MIPAPILSPLAVGSHGFSPDKLPGLAAWYSADQGVLNSISPDVPATDGQTVRRWLDRSINGRHLNQATLLSQPTVNSQGLLFNGTSSDMSVTVSLARPTTVYFAAQILSQVNNARWFSGGDASNRLDIQTIVSPSNSANLVGTGGDNTTVFSNVSYTGTKQIFTGIFNGASSVARLNLETADTGTTGNQSTMGLRVGSRGSEYTNERVFEWIIFTEVHTADIQEKVIRYLAKKWGITI